MLQAISDQGEFITPAICSEAEIGRMRGALFYCPDCRAPVILRAGEKVIPHFSHRARVSCSPDSQKGEGEYHRLGKVKLYQWLRQQKLNPALEVYLPQIKQRPDLLVHDKGKTFAIEFQCADINQAVWQKRTSGYLQLGIYPIWIIGANRFRRTGRSQMKIQHWMLLTLQQTSSKLPTSLRYFCPQTERFVIASDLHLHRSASTFAKIKFMRSSQVTLSDLCHSSNLSRQLIYQHWLPKKSYFRLQRNPSHGVSLDFRRWLYEQGRHPEQLPAIVYLPNSAQHWMRLHLWQWQTLFILKFLDPLQIGQSFTIEEVNTFLYPYRYPEQFYPLCSADVGPGEIYLQQLSLLQVVEQGTSNTWIKHRSIRYFTSLEEALIGDQMVVQHLIQYDQAGPDKLNHNIHNPPDNG